MYYYINHFLFYSFVGFLYENILHFVSKGHFTDNPFVGPIMPIYGFGIVIIILLTRLVFNRLKTNRWLKLLCLFVSVVVILTILEQLGGMLTEWVFHKSYWDYSKMRFNFGKYICLEVSLFWGVSCLVFLYLIKPLTDKIIKKVPHFISLCFLGLFVIDFVYSFFLRQ